jgi:hypothetical protein
MAECKSYEEADSCPAARGAAKEAVRQVFAILGVDIDSPKEVEEFRKSLRFGDSLRKAADKGFIAFILALLGVAWAVFSAGFKIKFLGGS